MLVVTRYSPNVQRLYRMNILHIRFVDSSKCVQGLMLHITSALWWWMLYSLHTASLNNQWHSIWRTSSADFVHSEQWLFMIGDTNIPKCPHGSKTYRFAPQAGPLGAVWRGLLIWWIIWRRISRWDHSWPHVTGSRLGIIRQAGRVRKHAGTLQRHVFQYSVFFQYSFSSSIFTARTSKKVIFCWMNLAVVFWKEV